MYSTSRALYQLPSTWRPAPPRTNRHDPDNNTGIWNVPLPGEGVRFCRQLLYHLSTLDHTNAIDVDIIELKATVSVCQRVRDCMCAAALLWRRVGLYTANVDAAKRFFCAAGLTGCIIMIRCVNVKNEGSLLIFSLTFTPARVCGLSSAWRFFCWWSQVGLYKAAWGCGLISQTFTRYVVKWRHRIDGDNTIAVLWV